TFLDIKSDPAKVIEALKGRTPEELAIIQQMYKQAFGKDLDDSLSHKLSGKDLATALDLLHRAKITENPDKSVVKDYPNGTQVEARSDGKVTASITSEQKGNEVDFNRRDFQYNDKGELTVVTSSFTGHTWTRTTDEQGKTAWVNEKGKVWHGDFSVDPLGNLKYLANNGDSYIFTADGKTQRLGKEAAAEAKSDAAAEAEKQRKAIENANGIAGFTLAFTHMYVTKDAGKVAEALEGKTPAE